MGCHTHAAPYGGLDLNAPEALFEATYRHSPIGMAVLDAGGRVVSVNEGMTRILGRAEADLVGRSFADYTHPDDLPRDLEAFAQVTSGEVPWYQLQKRYVDALGDTVWCRLTVTAVGVDDAAGTDAPALFIVQAEDVTEFRRAKDLLEMRAMYDPLTGLANGTLLVDRLKRALTTRAGRADTVAVLFCDVDHFSVVNDTLGHQAGDTLLAVVAERIQSAVRPGDTVARLGGDEFVVVLDGVADHDTAEDLAATIAKAVHAPIRLGEREIVPTLSIGLAMAWEGVSAETLVRDSDLAMFAAKDSGRSRIETYHAGMRETALNRISLEGELRAAVREGALVVHYQPVVDLATRKVAAFEALVRWDHPTRGLLLPSDFIEISEEANLVVPLGSYVLHEACGFLARHPEFAGRVFVNVSTRQVGAADLTRAMTSALASSGVDARRVCLEITESGMLMATKITRADLESIAGLGVDLILDDFGTGYSALSSVLQNPMAGLKLAKEFSSRLGDGGSGDRISHAMASLTAGLGMFGVVEGIETEAQHTVAAAHGWTFGQGYLYGRPTPEDELIFEALSPTAA